MKRIKRILTLLLALATALSLAACGTQKDEPAAGDDGAAAEEKKLVIYSAATGCAGQCGGSPVRGALRH